MATRSGMIGRMGAASAALALVAACGDGASRSEGGLPTTSAAVRGGAAPTSVPFATNPPSVASSTVSTAPSGVEPLVVEPAAGPVFVVFDTTVVGSWHSGRWFSADVGQASDIVGQALRPVAGGEPFTVASPAVQEMSDICPGWMQLEPAPPEGLLVSGDHSLVVRPVEDVGMTADDEAAVSAVLSADGVDAPVEIDRVVRFDLEGDGLDERLVEANRITGESLHGLPLGNYSVLLLRRMGGAGPSEDVVVYADTRPPDPETADSLTVAEIEGIVDVNGDGVLELVTSYAGYEWGGIEVRDLRDEPTVVMGAGCGV